MSCRSCAKRRAEREALLKKRREAQARKKKEDSVERARRAQAKLRGQ